MQRKSKTSHRRFPSKETNEFNKEEKETRADTRVCFPSFGRDVCVRDGSQMLSIRETAERDHLAGDSRLDMAFSPKTPPHSCHLS